MSKRNYRKEEEILLDNYRLDIEAYNELIGEDLLTDHIGNSELSDFIEAREEERANPGITKIQLTDGSLGCISTVDADLIKFTWSRHIIKESRSAYIYRMNEQRNVIHIHRLILERVLGRCLKSHEQVDHRNLDGLNNTRSNLRLANAKKNGQNRPKQRGNYTSQYKGVEFQPRRQKWYAYITVSRKKVHLGVFDTELEAALRYDLAAKLFFGKFARYNIGEPHE